mgnify:CR=1 FL=1
MRFGTFLFPTFIILGVYALGKWFFCPKPFSERYTMKAKGNLLFIVLLSQKKNELVSEHSDSVQTMKNMAKYPPALGMAGTVMGMIALFSSLDSNQGNIGKDLALAMTATFFGLILANAVFSPLADRLQVNQVHNQRLYRSLYEILLLINQDEPGSLIMDEVDHRAA